MREMKETFVIISIITIPLILYVVHAHKENHSSPSPIFAHNVHDATIDTHMYNYCSMNPRQPQERRRHRQLFPLTSWGTSTIRQVLKTVKKPTRKYQLKGHFSKKIIRFCNKFARFICAKKYNTQQHSLVFYQICHDDKLMKCLKISKK